MRVDEVRPLIGATYIWQIEDRQDIVVAKEDDIPDASVGCIGRKLWLKLIN